MDFHSRVRLIAHLNDKRIRSKTRGTNCHYQYLLRPAVTLSDETKDELQRRHRDEIRAARSLGHTHVIAHRPAKRTQPSVLKGLKRKPSNEAESKLVKRRVVVKQPPPIAYQKASTS